MFYEWDRAKAAENVRKHDTPFSAAILAIEDPNRLETLDTRFSYPEERIQITGLSGLRLLVVVVTFPDTDTCRIISARKATKHERHRYDTRFPPAW